MITDEQVPTVKKLWAAGLSASEIGAELALAGDAAVVRAAVMAAVNARAAPARKIPRSSMVLRNPRPVENDEGDDPGVEIDGVTDSTSEDDLRIPLDQRRSIFSVGKDECHWPVGDVRSPEFFFCGATAVEGEVYCRAHCRRAFTRAAHRRRAQAA